MFNIKFTAHSGLSLAFNWKSLIVVVKFAWNLTAVNIEKAFKHVVMRLGRFARSQQWRNPSLMLNSKNQPERTVIKGRKYKEKDSRRNRDREWLNKAQQWNLKHRNPAHRYTAVISRTYGNIKKNIENNLWAEIISSTIQSSLQSQIKPLKLLRVEKPLGLYAFSHCLTVFTAE